MHARAQRHLEYDSGSTPDRSSCSVGINPRQGILLFDIGSLTFNIDTIEI